ncbi:fimbrial protein [Cronobacter dublinensis]|nr:fimbrial protein [Cronobacter dublinensis]MDI7273093.1 fimbrial protein [Cronobacter dublinensis]
MTRLTHCAIALTMVLASGAVRASLQNANPASEFDLGLTGRVSMQGAIVSKACDIAMESRYQSIKMPDDTVGIMKRTGEGITKPFSIHLVNCTFDNGDPDSAPWHFLQVTFDGANDEGLFAVTGEAQGVALEIASKNGEQIYPGKPQSYTEISTDDIRLDYTLRLKANHEDLRPGGYSSVIKYRIDYF